MLFSRLQFCVCFCFFFMFLTIGNCYGHVSSSYANDFANDCSCMQMCMVLRFNEHFPFASHLFGMPFSSFRFALFDQSKSHNHQHDHNPVAHISHGSGEHQWHWLQNNNKNRIKWKAGKEKQTQKTNSKRRYEQQWWYDVCVQPHQSSHIHGECIWWKWERKPNRTELQFISSCLFCLMSSGSGIVTIVVSRPVDSLCNG